ncbi:hypothetical protein CGRA01v4_10771 [Colletotrichum graminicola]|nr:hypothetical protein CGRA01v4_10771 [Colletotrichum graminicola]
MPKTSKNREGGHKKGMRGDKRHGSVISSNGGFNMVYAGASFDI